MEISSKSRQSAFAFWLRTGRWPKERLPDNSAESKYNPWHDPENGQFTFANRGRYFAPGSGASGGRFGGGGASGSWTVEDRRRSPPARRTPPPAAPTQSVRPPAQATPAPSPPAPAQAAPSPARSAEPYRHIIVNGYSFEIDAKDRTRRVTGNLTLGETTPRSRRTQAQAGGPDRRPSDDGGHYIARRFNGPTAAFNHFAQDANFNRGKYRRLEDQWATAKKRGRSVRVKIVPIFEGTSQRPSVLDVSFWIDGKLESLKFSNEQKEDARVGR